MTREQRREALLRAPGGAPAYLAVGCSEVRYLCGFSGSNGWLLVEPDGPLLLTDGRYREQARDEAPDCRVEIAEHGLAAELAKTLGASRGVAYDPSQVTVALLRELEASVPAVEWAAEAGRVDRLRAVKDAAELARIEHALRLVESALVDVAATIAPGQSEREIAARLEMRCKESGAERMAFDTIVAGGARAALPHARPGNAEVRAGDLLVVDFGCVVDGYCSDLTRAVSLGEAMQEPWGDVWSALVAAQEAAIAQLADGAPARASDAAARRVLADAGLGEAFVHSLGHGVGLDIHEEPRLSERSDATLRAGMVVTVEPGIYLPGRGGMRLEDMVVIEERGARRLNRMGPEAIVAG